MSHAYLNDGPATHLEDISANVMSMRWTDWNDDVLLTIDESLTSGVTNGRHVARKTG